MVYRLLTVPMDYPIFASTGQVADDQPVEKDLNLEFSTHPQFSLPFAPF